MALNKKSCARIAAVIRKEYTVVMEAQKFLQRITKAADTNSKSFRKTMKRIAKAVQQTEKKLTTPRTLKRAA